MDNVADVTMTGETANNYFGNSVSSAGDVNGDGYSDVIVGAYAYSSYTGEHIHISEEH
ncbi:MAG: FG-GAP repeat protein [Ignavibacteria bacterium]|nr:FG-GAP repeat protein [Ignavibacteria bacterium]